jgi:two-component system, cell cycle sensor histidine kinase and response regulator CckA
MTNKPPDEVIFAIIEKEDSFFKTLVEFSRDPFYMLDPEDGGRMVYVNKAALAHYGYSLEKLLTMRIPDWDPAYDMNLLPMPPYDPAAGEFSRFETIHKVASGKLVPVEITSSIIELHGKIFVYGYFLDISERKAVEASLKESEKNLRDAQRIAHVGNWTSDLSKNLQSASEECYRIFGLSHKDFPRTIEAFLELVHPDDRDRVRTATENISDECQNHQLEFRVIRPDRSERIVKVHEEVVTYDPEKPARIVGTVQDITSQREAEEERLSIERKFQQSQKLESLGVLAGGIAHDFNNILMVILGNLDLALRELPEKSKASDRIGQALKAGRVAADLTKKMLAYAGKEPLQMKSADLNSFVRTNEDIFRSFMSQNVKLNIITQENLPMIDADTGQLLRMIMNLLINASEAIGDGAGEISITTGMEKYSQKQLNRSLLEDKPREGLFVWIEISDTGCGMDEETQRKIFEPFFSTKFAGRGLSMPETLGLVRTHGGAVMLGSKPGKGSTFRILFPAKRGETRRAGS